jgi:hypothetical protein
MAQLVHTSALPAQWLPGFVEVLKEALMPLGIGLGTIILIIILIILLT